MTQNSNKINFWRGTRFVFERKIQRNELIVGTVYFVGNSMEDVEGTGQSTYGVIYQAVSENRAVRYGIFATDDDITKLIEELTEKIDEESEERREADENITERIAHLIPEVADAVENHMAIFDSDGRLKDSGRDIVEFLMDGDIDDATIKFENGKLVVQDYSHKHHISDVDGLRGELDTKIGTEKMGTSNGIATLDENAKVNLEQMPYTDGYGIDITSACEIRTEPISDAEIDAMNAGERNGHLLDNLGLVKLWNKIVAFFVQKEDGKGLSSNDYTTAEKNKLAGIESGAEVNVQSDWNQTDDSADDFIKNKPTLRQPATDGTTGQYLKSNGSNNAPSWETMDTAPTAASTKAVTSGGVKTALDAKQPNISITTNTSTPTDNDTVIMQASGTTNTTTFLRRTMSKIWEYIKSKANSVYWRSDTVVINNKYTIDYSKEKIMIFPINDSFYAADKRLNVTWNTYNSSTDELLRSRSSEIPGLFIGNYENHSAYPQENEYDVITFANPNQNYYLFGNGTFSNGTLAIHFRGARPVNAPIVTIDTGAQITYPGATFHEAGASDYYTYSMPQRTKTLAIKIQGVGDGSDSYGGASPTSIIFYRIRQNIQSDSVVSKHAVKQDLYGDVEAPKFIVRGGTSQQVLLANGATINMPSTTGTNKDTLLKNLVSGLSSGTSDVTDTTQIVTSSTGGFSATSYVNVPFKRPATSFWNYIKGKADNIYTQKGDSYTVTMNADANHQGTNEYRVLATLATADCCVLNITKTIYGYPAQNTVWFANQNSVSLISLADSGFVAIGGRAGQSADLCVRVLPTGHPAVEYKIQIVRSTDSESVTFPSSATYKTQNRPMRANVVMRDEISTDAVTFNITSGVSSVSLEDSNDFIGNVTDASTSAGITVTGYEQGQCYRFTFTEELEGVTLYSSNSVALCTVNETIQKGDVLTFTSVSNTAGGWMYSKTGASIKSSDGSVNIEWEDGVADLSVEKVPFNNLVNNAMFQEGDSPYPLAVGSGAVSLLKSGDEDYPYELTQNAKLVAFKVDDSTTNVYSYFVNGGTTYSLNASGTIISYTPSTNKYIYIIDPGTMDDSEKIVAGQNWYIDGTKYTTDEVVKSGGYYVVGGQNILSGMDSSTIVNAMIFIKNNIAYNGYPQALGLMCEAKGKASMAVGIRAESLGGWSVAIGNSAYALEYGAIAIGGSSKACGDFSINIGNQSSVIGNRALAIGYYARVKGLYSIALGNNSKAYSEKSVAIGNYSATALERAIAIGDNAYAGYDSNDADYPKYLVKRFTAIDFTENGVTKKVRWVGSDGEVTIVLNGNTITLSAPNNNSKFFIIVNDSLAARIGKPLTGYAKINGVETYFNIGGYAVTPVAVNGNSYYALWMYSTQTYFRNTINSFSFLAYYKATYSQGYMFAFGYNAIATNTHAIAFGNETRAIRDRQIVIGSGNLPDENALFIIGGGSSTGNSRKNILTIDGNEIVHARAYISDAVTYELNGASVSLGTITMGLLKVTGGGALTLTSTNAVEGHCVKVYASGTDITCNGDSITAGRWREYLFIDGAWSAQM